MSTKFPLLPLYSSPCEVHNQPTLVARCATTGRLQIHLFDPETLQIQPTVCNCCVVIEHLNNFETKSARGVRFERSHKDELGNPIICLHVNWDEAIMDTFVNPNGQVGKYRWDDKKKTFQRTQVLDVRFEAAGPSFNRTEKVITDDQILPYATGYCDDHGGHLLVREILSESSLQGDVASQVSKYRWNTYREQFEEISCDCVSIETPPIVVSEDCERFMAVVMVDGRKIEVMKTGDRLEKIVTEEARKSKKANMISVLPSERVRNLRGKDVKALQALRIAEQRHHGVRNNWSFDTPNFWYYVTRNGVPLYTDMAGRIGPNEKHPRDAAYDVRMGSKAYDDDTDEEEESEDSEDSDDDEVPERKMTTREDDGFDVVSVGSE